ncbi:MAG: hypothetical protein V9H26_09135 [Verrucomicrobiota bacterium]
MKTQTTSTRVQVPHDRKSSYSTIGLRAAVAAGLVLLGAQFSAVAQVDDFNDGNDTGWDRYDAGSQLTLAGAPFNVPGVYSFPSGAYRMQGQAFPTAFGAGPTRLGAYRNDVNYTNAQVGVEIATWDNSLNQAFGLLFRVKNLFLGGTEGYTMNYNNTSGDLQINLTVNEAPTTIGETTYTLDPAGGPYRMVGEGYNSLMVVRVFRSSDPTTPIMAVIADESTYPDGKCGIFTYDNKPAEYPTPGCDTTFDNYAAAAAAHYPPIVTELLPRPFSAGARILPEIKVAVLDRETTVNPTTIVLTVDGTVVPLASLTIANEVLQPGNSTPFAGVTVTYTPTSLPTLSGPHTCNIAFQDNLGASQNVTWTFSFTQLAATNAAPLDSGANPGFNVRLVQADPTNTLDNSLSRALIQLGPNPPSGWVVLDTNFIASVINFTQKDTNTGTDGNFANDANFPGIDPSLVPDPNDLAMEIHTFLQLPAGAYTFGVICDDGFQLSSGNGFVDPSPVLLSEKTSGTFNGTFDFDVAQPGLYPFKMLWFERGGGAHVELWVHDRNNPANNWLVGDPAGPVRAWQQVRPHIATSSKSGNSFSCTLHSYTGVAYVLEYKNAMTDPSWTPLAPVPGNGGDLTLNDPTASVSGRFYQVRVQ